METLGPFKGVYRVIKGFIGYIMGLYGEQWKIKWKLLWYHIGLY